LEIGYFRVGSLIMSAKARQITVAATPKARFGLDRIPELVGASPEYD
jgi:hypothetical protein